MTPAFGAQPGLDYSMQRSPRDALYPPPHMVSSHIQSTKFSVPCLRLTTYAQGRNEDVEFVMFNVQKKLQVHALGVPAVTVIMRGKVVHPLATIHLLSQHQTQLDPLNLLAAS